jgi:hypothetical protein
MQTDNTTALSVVSNNIMKKLKAMDMTYLWLQCAKVNFTITGHQEKPTMVTMSPNTMRLFIIR